MSTPFTRQQALIEEITRLTQTLAQPLTQHLENIARTTGAAHLFLAELYHNNDKNLCRRIIAQWQRATVFPVGSRPSSIPHEVLQQLDHLLPEGPLLLVHDVPSPLAAKENSPHIPGHARLLIPITTTDAVWGLLCITYEQATTLSPLELPLLSSIATLLHEAVSRQYDAVLFEVQRSLSQRLNNEDDFKQALSIGLEEIQHLPWAECIGIYIFNEDGSLNLRVHYGLPDEFVEYAHTYSPQSSRSQMVQDGRPIFSTHRDVCTQLGDTAQAVLDANLQALAILPLVHDQKTIGCLNIASRTHEVFSPSERAAMQLVALHFSAVLLRIQANTERRQSRHNFTQLFNSIDDFLFVLDQAGNIIAFNDTVSQRLGYSAQELQHMHVLDCHPPERRTEAGQIVQAMLEKKLTVCPIPLMTKQRTLIPVETKVVLGKWDGQTALLGISRDISQRLRMEDERRAMDKKILEAQKFESLGVLSGGIAHDFNNLLVGVLGNANLIATDPNADAFARNSAHDIEKAAMQAAELVKQLLAYTGQDQGYKEELDLSKELAHLQHTHTQIHFSLAEELPTIQGDPHQLRQVVSYLLNNALEACEHSTADIRVKTGSITLSEHTSGALPTKGVYLEVSDNGQGMDAETRQKMFDPFFSTKFPGRGLGLAAVQGIVRTHNGTIEVTSHPEQGTTVRIILPTIQEAGKAEPSKANDLWHGSGSILLVDDEELVRKVGTRMLERIGFHVLTANDGLEALDVLEHCSDIDLIILDCAMPRLDGVGALKQMHEKQILKPVLLCSGFSEQETSERFKGLNVAGIVEKPFDFAALASKIKNALPH